MFKSGLNVGMASTLLLSTNLALRFKVDLRRDMGYFYAQSEEMKAKVQSGGKKVVFEKTIDKRLQERVSFDSHSTRTSAEHCFVLDGKNWYQLRDRSLCKGDRADDKSFKDAHHSAEIDSQCGSMFMMNNRLYVRIKSRPDEPFVEVDKETLNIKEEQTQYQGENGADHPLKWTPNHTTYQ